LLGQNNSDIAGKFLDLVPSSNLFISDFTLHSIGVILTRYKKFSLFEIFITDLFTNAGIEVLSLNGTEHLDIAENMSNYNLDFDDAYQLTLSQKYDFTLVTFDKDFNISGIIRKSPDEIIMMLTN
jgi:predicted nucleic acid-binding protein